MGHIGSLSVFIMAYRGKQTYIHTTKNSTDAVLVNSKKVGLQENAEKTKYKFMPHEQHIRESHGVKIRKKSWKSVAKFKCFRNCRHKEIKGRLNMGMPATVWSRIFQFVV